MEFRGFIKLPRRKGFNYKPLYYDAEKERREIRKRELEKVLGSKDIGAYVPTITHGSMRAQSRRGRTKAQRISNIRLIILIIILLFLAYLILYR